MTHSSIKFGSAVSKSIGVLALAGSIGVAGGGFVMQALAQSGSVKSGSSRSMQGYLGVYLSDVTDDQLGALKLKEARGAEIMGMDHDGPACKSGMQMHDVILQMNGQPVESSEQLRRMLRDTPSGRQVTFIVSRDGQQTTVSTQLSTRGEVEKEAREGLYHVPEPEGSSSIFRLHGNSFLHSSPSSAGSVKGTHSFLGTNLIVSSSYTGAKLEVMGPQLAEYFGAQGSSGLFVREVEANSPAADAGLKAGDVVVKVNSQQVVNGNDWSKTIHENRGKPVSIMVLRDKKEQTITLTPDSRKRSSVDTHMDLEEFFGNSDQADETRVTLAELAPMFDAMTVTMHQRTEEVRATPEMQRMMARLQTWSANPDFQRQMETAQRQVQAAAEAARERIDSPELQERLNRLRMQMRDTVRLD